MLAAQVDWSDLGQIGDAGLVRERAFIGGRWCVAADLATVDVVNPADGARLGSVPRLGAADADRAVEAAEAALMGWRALLPQERATVLRRWHDLILDSREDLALLMTLEQGKPLAEARGEIDYAASFVDWYAEETKRVNVESITSHLVGADMQVRREPLGVVALVTPWNFPAAMITRKAAAGLAAGCTAVLHPSVQTPFSALALVELANRAGMPAGVFNVVTGEAPEIVGALCRHPAVRAVSFTGSTEVGRIIAAQCAPGIKRLLLELGGHAPFIVFPDADLDRALDHAIAAKYATSGQDCLAVNRFMIHTDVHDAFVDRFAERSAALKVGDGRIEGVDIGPLMHERAVAKCLDHIDDALRRGARVLSGGGRDPAGPQYVTPTVLADVPPEARIWHEETFGPVAAFARFTGEAEVLAAANATAYGLVAYLQTRDQGRISRMVAGLDHGMVAVNRAKITGAPVPFGGVKQSGLGREGGRMGLEAFTEVKYVCLETT